MILYANSQLIDVASVAIPQTDSDSTVEQKCVLEVTTNCISLDSWSLHSLVIVLLGSGQKQSVAHSVS